MWLLVYIGAYLYGSLPVVYLLGRQRDVDLKKVGSGNVGATNLMASGSAPLAIAGWLFDASKGAVPIVAAHRLGCSEEVAEMAGVCGVAGQCWPLFLGFSGGRGISAYVGASAMMDRRAWGVSLLPMIGGALWRVAPMLRRRKSLGTKLKTTRGKSVPLSCFITALTFPLACSILRHRHRGMPLASILLSLVILLRRLTAAQPDDATAGPLVRPQALIYRLLYDRNTSE